MPRGVAASGWCVVLDARSVASVCLPSINWMRCDCSTGWPNLEKTDPRRAERIRVRAQDSVRRLAAEFPGNAQTGVLDEGPEG